ncbi:predicted protein [Uncinocarpus reesii 1704]|uniref:C2H2-type domain-containing protein n=1 Tax=Uncinocarpus reesii (strain UAMH 1704) TaxID=336963 RepID=C4JVX8_UNCRE|nr:uncharacterized protein UREG_06720 [Uncinocarpus reesii 1704]EEP81855.1 predicted protein [Uncinocarpus reesii 1704]
MYDEVYDSDDLRPTTPPLEQVKPDLRPHEDTPPPFLPEKSESPKEKESPSGRVRKGSHRRWKGRETSIGIQLIIQNLDSNRPDLAYQLKEAPLHSDSPSDTSEADDGVEQVQSEKHRDTSTNDVPPCANSACELKSMPPDEETKVQQRKPQDLLNLLNNQDDWEEPNESTQIHQEQASSEHDRIPYRSRMHSQEPKFGYQLPRINSNPEDRTLSGRLPRQEELAHPSHKDPRLPQSYHASLPALSPPQSIGSPDSGRNLPSIKTLVGGSFEEPARFPTLTTLEPQYIPPSFRRAATFGHLSPASSKDLPSLSLKPITGGPQNTIWAPQLNAECSQSQSPGDTSSHFTGSPAAGYPTPVEPGKDEPEEPLPFNKRVKTSTPQNTGGFKCDYPGCTAEPFQTQYLLNSHANVHSDNRPYYCPVKDCSRSKGRRGFKRKNEMIRHGLVHDSPGYICPFCSDQQRRYPRPDNLQRHVRAQHPDKDKEDPLLREVLSIRVRRCSPRSAPAGMNFLNFVAFSPSHFDGVNFGISLLGYPGNARVWLSE